MRITIRIVAQQLVSLVLIGMILGCAGGATTKLTKGTASLANTQAWIMRSEKTQREYQIWVALPNDYYSTDERYEVIYGVDANMEFGSLAETARNLAAEGALGKRIVVGIGYPGVNDWSHMTPHRFLDFTPTEDLVWLSKINEDLGKYNLPVITGSGGAEGFTQFLRDELIPLIGQDYRVKRGCRTLFGHSIGGLFGLFVLLKYPDLFDAYIVASPSLWWNDGVSFAYEEEAASKTRLLKADVFMSAAELEEEGPDGKRYAMVANMKRMAAQLNSREYEGFKLTTHIFEGETHMSVIPAAISRGLRTVCSD